jgi:hypothetical protein
MESMMPLSELLSHPTTKPLVTLHRDEHIWVREDFYTALKKDRDHWQAVSCWVYGACLMLVVAVIGLSSAVFITKPGG